MGDVCVESLPTSVALLAQDFLCNKHKRIMKLILYQLAHQVFNTLNIDQSNSKRFIKCTNLSNFYYLDLESAIKINTLKKTRKLSINAKHINQWTIKILNILTVLSY